MRQYQELRSTQYYTESIKERLTEHRRERRSANRKAFWQIGLSFLLMGSIAYTMHMWMPALFKLLEFFGW